MTKMKNAKTKKAYNPKFIEFIQDNVWLSSDTAWKTRLTKKEKKAYVSLLDLIVEKMDTFKIHSKNHSSVLLLF